MFSHAHVFNWRKCIKLFHSVSRVKCDDIHLRLPPTIAELTNVDNNFCYQVHLSSTSTSSRYFFQRKSASWISPSVRILVFFLFSFREIFIGIVLTIRMVFLFNFVKKHFLSKNKEKIHWRRKNESFERWKDWIFDITSRHLSIFFNGSKELLKIREKVCMSRNPFANTGTSIYFISLENHFLRILLPNKGFCLFFFV